MATVAERLRLLREQLIKHQLDGCIIYSQDPHGSEYVPDSEQRRQWLSGFTGSAGTVVVTHKDALLWTDGRYYTQAETQLANTGISLMKLEGPSIPDWLKAHHEDVKSVGMDPLRLSISEYKLMVSSLEGSVAIKLTPTNLVDEIWEQAGQRPPAPNSTVVVHGQEYAGQSAIDKLERLRAKLVESCVDVAVLSQLEDVAWVTNLRANDVAYTPVFNAYMAVSKDAATVYVDESRVSKEARKELKKAAIAIQPYESLFDDLARLPSGMRVWLDLNANVKLYKTLEDAEKHVHLAPSPVSLDKATKNDVELEGFKTAHLKDGLAVSCYLAYLDSLSAEDLSNLTEFTASQVLDKIRLSMPGCVDLSFPTISGIGPNGAVIHYIAEEATARKMAKNEVYLVDSGGQYREGTTDITRTVFLGTEPTKTQKTVYTLVLKGHLHIARIKVPQGIMASQIDGLARQYLWAAGLNYTHGTGHGVGSYLGVHEGPIHISFIVYGRQRYQEPPLRAGLVLSNEPGCYLENKFGVRIENLMYTASETYGETLGEAEGIRFFNLTCVPYDRRLIDVDLLTSEEVEQIDSYHEWCRECLLHTLGAHGKHLEPALAGQVREWIDRNTQKLLNHAE